MKLTMVVLDESVMRLFAALWLHPAALLVLAHQTRSTHPMLH